MIFHNFTVLLYFWSIKCSLDEHSIRDFENKNSKSYKSYQTQTFEG